MSKEQIVQIFRIAVAAAAGKIDDATEAFRGILADSDVSGIDVHSVKDVFLEPVPQWRGSVAATVAAVKAAAAASAASAAGTQTTDDDEDYSDMPPLISFNEARGYPPAPRSTVPYDAAARMIELNQASLFPTATCDSGSDQNIDLVITETSVDNDRHTATSAAGTPAATAATVPSTVIPVSDAVATVATVADAVAAFELGDDDNDVEEAEDEVEEAEDEAEDEVEDEVEEEAEEEASEEDDEAVELNLEPVRIKKVIYWKDTDSGDLYAYLPDDEVGDKVGAYVNGKPVFD